MIQSWSDKSSGTTLWTPPSAGVTVRGTSYGAGNGRTTSLLADSGGPVSAGTYGAQTASTDASSGRAIEWTIALAPQAAGANADRTRRSRWLRRAQLHGQRLLIDRRRLDRVLRLELRGRWHGDG